MALRRPGVFTFLWSNLGLTWPEAQPRAAPLRPLFWSLVNNQHRNGKHDYHQSEKLLSILYNRLLYGGSR